MCNTLPVWNVRSLDWFRHPCQTQSARWEPPSRRITDSNKPCHAETDLKISVGAIPKEGLAGNTTAKLPFSMTLHPRCTTPIVKLISRCRSCLIVGSGDNHGFLKFLKLHGPLPTPYSGLKMISKNVFSMLLGRRHFLEIFFWTRTRCACWLLHFLKVKIITRPYL